jgi:GntR family transcriptional regulator, transcriptional repressor for pyruvate dehydrogenase complex
VHVTPVANRTAAENVRTQLIEQIRSGSIEVDSRLPSEAELAKAFGVSRSVVREALHSLNALGLTRSHPGKGTFVAANDVAPGLLSGLYRPSDLNEVRQTLEVPVARLAAARRSTDDLDRMQQLLDTFDLAADALVRVQVDADFHLAVAAATGNPLFTKLVGDLRQVLQAQALRVSNIPGRAAQAGHEHRLIYEAILVQDEDAAGTAMHKHLGAVISLAAGDADADAG